MNDMTATPIDLCCAALWWAWVPGVAFRRVAVPIIPGYERAKLAWLRARIGAGIQREGGQIVAIVVDDFCDAIAHVSGNGFAFAEYFMCDGIE